MENLITYTLAFLVTIAILIAVHEYGHFWVARRLGVKVLRFSIGFGKPLWKRTGRKDGTEYVIAAVPLGGYVKMLDEREEAVPEDERHRAFNRQKLWVRSAIVAAGPLANFVFAILVFWLVFVLGDTGLRPLVGEVLPDTPAAEARFESGDELLQVAGSPVRTWTEAIQALLMQAREGEPVPVAVRNAEGGDALRVLAGSALVERSENRDLLRAVGLTPKLPSLPPVLGQVLEGEAMDQAGLQAGDRILALDEQPITDWREFADYIRERPGRLLPLRYQRNGEQREAQLLVGTIDSGGERIGRVGAAAERPADLYADYQVLVRLGWGEAMGAAVVKTWDTSGFLLRVLWRLVTGNASIDNLGGPIAIAESAGKSAAVGLTTFLKFLASISIILAVMNLLPVPVLDGGHLLFFAIEAVKGSELSEASQLLGQKIGLALLLALMTLAFYVDIARLLG